MSFEETLAIADAMATRQGKVAAISEQIRASLYGMQYEPKTPEQIREAHIGQQIYLITRVEQPNTEFKLEDMLDAAGNSGNYAALAKAIGSDGEFEVDIKSAKDFAHAVLGEFKSSMGDIDEKMTQSFAKMLENARELAAERGVTVADVYLTDELYYEASRRTTSLEEAAQILCDALEAFSEEMMNRVIVTQMQNLLPKELMELITPEELNEMILEMQLDPELQAQFSQQVELGKEGVRQSGEYLLSATYGDDAFSRLSVRQQELLTPRMGRAPDHVDFSA